MKEPIQISIERPTLTVPTIEQVYYEVVFSSRIEVLSRLLDTGKIKMGLVFANTKKVVDDVVDGLTARGYPVDRLHGDMPQMMRERVMDSFLQGEPAPSGGDGYCRSRPGCGRCGCRGEF